jgi:hypothetical protein
VYFYSLRYPACNALAPNCHLWHTQLYNIFLHYLINGAILGKKQDVFQVSVQLLSETLFILRRTERDMIGNAYWSTCKVPFISCPILIKLKVSRQIFEKYSNIKFNENPSSGSRVFPGGRMDRHEGDNCRFLQFCESAKNLTHDVRISCQLHTLIYAVNSQIGLLKISHYSFLFIKSHLSCMQV